MPTKVSDSPVWLLQFCMTVILRQAAPQPERGRQGEMLQTSVYEFISRVPDHPSNGDVRACCFSWGGLMCCRVLTAWADTARDISSLLKKMLAWSWGDRLNASKGPWNLKASGKDGCQAYLTYHFLWSEMIFFMAYHISWGYYSVFYEKTPMSLFLQGLQIPFCCWLGCIQVSIEESQWRITMFNIHRWHICIIQWSLRIMLNQN